MTDYRKRLERLAGGENPVSVYPIRAIDPADDMLEITVFDALQHAADLSKLLSEGERMRELVADLERRAEACDKMFRKATDGLSQYRLGGKADAYRHAALTARQALGDPE